MHIKYNSEWCTSLIGVSMTLLSPNFCHSPRLTCNGSDSLQNLSIKYWNAMHSSLCLTVEVLYGLYSASSLNNYWAPLLTLQVKHFSQWQAPSLCLPPPHPHCFVVARNAHQIWKHPFNPIPHPHPQQNGEEDRGLLGLLSWSVSYKFSWWSERQI